MQVQLDMFSGRPNPEWELPVAVEQELVRLERGLFPCEAAANPPALGYRGFVYGEGRDLRRVFGGILTRSGSGFEDSGHRIERLLAINMPEPLKPLWAYLPASLRKPGTDAGSS